MTPTTLADPDHLSPTIDEITANREILGSHVLTTPVWEWQTGAIEQHVGGDTHVTLKLELFQHAGSFKPRGALTNMLALDPDALRRGVTAISAGNHAVAVGYAARVLGTSAKVVVPRNANPARVARARAYGAEVVIVDDVHVGFNLVKDIERDEGRAFIHPFEGPRTVLGTATVGLELIRQAPGLDAVIVPVGGGGLLAGIAAAVKQLSPLTAVYGVEPEGADTMYRSFRSGATETLDKVRTIADSLGAPYSAPYSLAVCRRHTDEIVLIDDDAICRAMAVIFSELKLAVEPAGAAATAALFGPLRERLQGKRVGLIICGANIDSETFAGQIRRGESVS